MAISHACLICGKLSEQRRCPEHRRDRMRAEAGRPSTSARGYDARWRKTREAFLKTHPLCEWPDGCSSPAKDVHHLDGLGPSGPRGHDPANLQSLCHRHHAMLTAREKPAGIIVQQARR